MRPLRQRCIRQPGGPLFDPERSAPTLRRERSVETAYVRCLGATTGTVLPETVRGLRNGGGDLAHNTLTEDVIDELHSAVRDTAVVVLDEADDVDDRASNCCQTSGASRS